MMLYSIVRVMLCFAAIALSSCTTHTSHPQRAHDSALCKMSCQERFKTCSQVCYKNCQNCSKTANGSAVRLYRQYVHEQYVQGGMISRDLNSYRDPLQCRKTTCNCIADYTVCKAACTGIIRKRLQVGPACCNLP